MGEQIIRTLKCNKCGSMLLLQMGDMHSGGIKEADKKKCPVCKTSNACYAHHVQETTLEAIKKALTTQLEGVTPEFKQALFDFFSSKPQNG